MITLEIQRHIIAEVRVSTSFMPEDLMIEVRGSTVYFRSRGLLTELNCLEAKNKPSLINNSIRTLISDIYNYEADNVVKFVLELI